MSGGGHIQRRGANSWRIKYDIGRDPLTGKRITKFRTVHGTKKDAQRELRELLGEVDRGMHCDPGKLMLGQWLEQWLAEAKHGTSAKTHERYSEIVHKHLIPALGALPLAKLAPVHIQQYYSEALASGRRNGKGGLSPQTVRHHDRVLNVALKRARQLRLLASNPTEDVTAPKVERRRLEVLEPDESARLLATAATTRLYAPIALALGTGMRRGEVLALRWQDVDLDGASLRVVQSLEVTDAGLRLKAPKTKRSRRMIALSPSIVELLRRHRAEQAQERLQLGLGRNESGLVFTQVNGEPVNPDNFSKEFARLVKRAGIRPVTFHGLRHAHITALLQAGVHPKVASERAGHSTVAVTLDIYSHVTQGMQEDAAARIDAGLRKILG